MRGRDKHRKIKDAYTHYWEPDPTYPNQLRTMCGAVSKYKADVIPDIETRLCRNCEREERKRGRFEKAWR